MGSLEITELSETSSQANHQHASAIITAANKTSNQPETPQDSASSSAQDQDDPSILIDLDSIIGHPWTTGLFDWRQNRRNAIITALLPCVTFGQIAEVLDEGKSSCGCRGSCYGLLMLASYSQWILSTEYRSKLRKKFNLEEAPYTDVASHIFCKCYALCQEYRELQNRGLDPSLGWKGILAQQQERLSGDVQLSVAPPNQVMSK